MEDETPKITQQNGGLTPGSPFRVVKSGDNRRVAANSTTTTTVTVSSMDAVLVAAASSALVEIVSSAQTVDSKSLFLQLLENIQAILNSPTMANGTEAAAKLTDAAWKIAQLINMLHGGGGDHH